MKTEQEQIEEMQEIIGDCWEFDSVSAELGNVDGYINIEESAKALVQAGYGDVSEYKAEIKQLKAKNKVLGDGVAKAFTNGFNTGRKQVEKDIRRAQIDVLNKLKDSYGLYYLSAFGVKERMLADILNPMIEELKK